MNATEFFIEEQPAPTQGVLRYLHELLLSYPEMTTKIRYKIPFYYRKSWICYLNPLKTGGVELAFTRGNELSNTQGLLQFNGRKQVAGLTFQQLDDVSEVALHEIIQEALLLDEEVAYASKRKG